MKALYPVKVGDVEIQPVIDTLRAAGLETDWSCSGEPGHMCIRPTIHIHTGPVRDARILHEERNLIVGILKSCGWLDFWLSLVWGYGSENVHGSDPYWLIEAQGRHDFVALPIAYSMEYTDGPDDILEGYQSPLRQAEAKA